MKRGAPVSTVVTAAELVLVVFLAQFFYWVRSQEVVLQSHVFSAIYVFGDSLTDSGNNNNLNIAPSQGKANYMPYGIDFVQGPTGRFTNGKNMADFTAEKLGLPYPTAFLSLSPSERQTIKTGMNYASGGCGILKETGSALGNCVPLDEQIDHFQTTIEEDLLPQFDSEEEVLDHLAKSVVVVNIGSNDLLNNWIQDRPEYNRSKQYTRTSDFVGLLMLTLYFQVEKIYFLGARRFMIYGLGPIGCIPLVTSKGAPCSEPWNAFAIEFNNQLGLLVQLFQQSFPHGSSVFTLDLNSYYLSMDMHQNPDRYGFVSSSESCCVFDDDSQPATLCIAGTTPCPNRGEYMYYDMFHPTSKTVEIISNATSSVALRQLAADHM